MVTQVVIGELGHVTVAETKADESSIPPGKIQIDVEKYVGVPIMVPQRGYFMSTGVQAQRRFVEIPLGWISTFLLLVCSLAIGAPVEPEVSSQELPSVWSQVDELSTAKIEPPSGSDSTQTERYSLLVELRLGTIRCGLATEIVPASTELLQYAPKLPPPSRFAGS